MAEAILICGPICSGKTTYAHRLLHDRHAVLLSVDEITLAMFGQHTGENHDLYRERLQAYLFGKSLEMIGKGIDVILDWGFWQKEDRSAAREFYKSHGVTCSFHAICISHDEWKRRLAKRNRDVLDEKVSAYYVDEGLGEKFSAMYESPADDEIDVWIKNE